VTYRGKPCSECGNTERYSSNYALTCRSRCHPHPNQGQWNQRRVASKYGLTLDGWHELLIEQRGRCGICSRPMKKPHVDHDHATDRVRGLLCAACNWALHLIDNGLLPKALKWIQHGS
jgi:hypothetical protein